MSRTIGERVEKRAHPAGQLEAIVIRKKAASLPGVAME